ncbi:unnamed protein product [Penicillium nalgiovense]|nr:unnamed protein product [Penicillium nalgiovense]
MLITSMSQANAHTLLHRGVVTPGKPVVLFFEGYWQSVEWYWSVVAAGGIPTVLPPLKGGEKSRNKELDHISRLFDHPYLITTTSSSSPFDDHGGFQVFCTDQINTQSHSVYQYAKKDSRFYDRGNGQENTTCTILFTSGSTGPSKAVKFTHRQLVTSSLLKCSTNRMGANDMFLCWITFDHSVALCELHLQAMAAGSNMVMIPPAEFSQDPLKFWRVLSDSKIAYTFAPNSFLAGATRAYNDARNQQTELPAYNFNSLRVLFCGGEANKTGTLKAAADLLSTHGAPDNAVTAVYGLSETCSALFYNRNGPSYDVKCKYAFASVGVPLPTNVLRIVDSGLRPVRTGAVQLQGSMIFNGYYNDAKATKSCFTSDGWFDTGDLGSLDEQGSLVIIGRSKEVLVLNGQKISSGELEYSIEASDIPGLEAGFTASFSIWSDRTDSEEVVILFNPAGDQIGDTPWLRAIIGQINKAVIEFCKKRPCLVLALPKSELPKSSIGKLSRSKLKAALLAGEFDGFKLSLAANQYGDNFMSSRQKAISHIFEDRLQIPASELSADLPIASLGIDSLGYLRLKSGIEKAFSLAKPLSVPQMLACQTIRDIDSAIDDTSREELVPYAPVKVLRSTGSKTPLIFCPPANGGFLNYMALWPRIPDRKILALYSRGLEWGQQPFRTLEDMLDTFVAGIKDEQPTGPYALIGSCFGGIMAFELAKRLEALGEEVVFCAGMDSVPGFISIVHKATDERHILAVILESTGAINRSDIPGLLEKLAPVPVDKIIESVPTFLAPGALEDAGLYKVKLGNWIDVSMSMHLIASDYNPSGATSVYDAFYTATPPRDTVVPDAASWRYIYLGEWKNHVVGASNYDVSLDYADMPSNRRADRPLRLHRISGVHEDMTTLVNIESLSRTVNEALLLREEEWSRNKDLYS